MCALLQCYLQTPQIFYRFKHPYDGWTPVALKVESLIHGHYAFQGKEYSTDYFDVLTASDNEFKWVAATNGCPCANDILGNNIFHIGRFLDAPTTIIVGKVHHNSIMYYPCNSKESISYHYDCLCRNI